MIVVHTLSSLPTLQAMVMMVGKGSFKQELSSTLKDLAGDTAWSVRRTIACGFNEVVHVLEEKADQVTHIYQNLLKDESEEVHIQ